MMILVSSLLLILAVVSRVECQRNTPRSPRASRIDGALEFECPEEFGYYPHPRDCTQYYVCVFGGALLESCTGGLMYSHELQTCDWPRNVGCQSGASSNQDVEDEDPLLERAAKAESQQRQHQQRQPIQRQQVQITSPSPSLSQIPERQSRHRPQQQQQQQHRTYPDEEYEPASEIESDRQQRVYRGQPSTIGQVQRDRDGLRRNIISVSSTHPSHPASITTPPTPPPPPQLSSNGDNDSVGHETTASQLTASSTTTKDRDITTLTSMTTTSSSSPAVASNPTANLPAKSSLGQTRDRKDYAIHEATRRNYVIVSSPSPFKLPPREDNNDDDDLTVVTTPESIRTSDDQSDQAFQVNFIPDPSVSSPAEFSKLSEIEQRIDSTVTQSIGVTDDLEQNEISVSPPATRKRPIYDFYDEPIGKGDYLTGSSPLRPRIKSRFTNRGKERYHGSNYVTMKVVRKRPVIDRDQDSKDSFKSDVTVPLSRSTTPQMPSSSSSSPSPSPSSTPSPLPLTSAALAADHRKKMLAPQKVPVPTVKSDRFDDTPTTLSPLKRAFIMSKLQQQRDQEDVEGNEIYPTSSLHQQYKSFESMKHDISSPQTLKSTSNMSTSTTSTTTTSTSTSTRIAAAKLELSTTPTPFRRHATAGARDEIERNEISATSASVPPAVHSPAVNQLRTRHDKKDLSLSADGSSSTTAASTTTTATATVLHQHPYSGQRRTSTTLEREKESFNTARSQTDSPYRTIPSENPRVKTTASTPAAPAPTISKAYYDHDSYPYYLYDDDVSIYKDDDYPQYAINQSVGIQSHPPQQQTVRIAEVTPNSKTYTQKSKKVPANDVNKYNFNSEVTAADYDIYDNQGHKNKFHLNDGQSYRPNSISPQLVHVTTPNAIVDAYVPLTTTTKAPPTTTARPYTPVTVPSRSRPHVNRGTAPPRLRPTLKPSTEIVSKAQEYVDIYRYPALRPAPIYPTPQVDKPAAKCRKDVCLLPDCNCGGPDIPGGLAVEQTPQIVLVTFDDAVNDLNKQLYEDLFERGRKNPNGCPISATFYVSHEWTDYSQVQNLYADGHELASHTVSHSFGEQFSARKWAREVAGQREILAAYGGVKLEDVKGMRAPFLSVGGNNMFRMLWETNFTYDSSMPIYENRPPSWPYTLDYKLFHDCMIPPCPTRSYPGLWEVPMVMWQDLNGGRCSMGDACSNPPTADGVYKMLIKNFERHYTTNRAPFGLFYHAAWFTQPHHKEGFISFLDTIVAMDDVWVITNTQAIEWVRNPTPLALLDTFEPFGCNYQGRPKKCNNPKVCNLWHKSGVRYMKTCQPCPDIYPWTGKTGIRSSRIDNEIEN
ncbi:mucin-5AC isoform X1 [Microplitis demolitor]|uniref:mucin-5AC isoform X1 n=1 Tax=Microplitis demolitor TaxID=69319 RepID=UPI0004CCF483|nr:mucin-5AC isoform X1 [Microplitis demolitor]